MGMTREEAKSCICTIKMLQKLAYNIHGVMDVVDADNCKKIIKALEQEPCEEQEIYEKAYKEGYDKGWSDGNFIGANRWIPISERLPEVNQRVLVTSYGRVCYAMMTSADGNSGHPVFRLQDSLNERVVCETTVHSEFTTSRIIAWMPLPKLEE